MITPSRLSPLLAAVCLLALCASEAFAQRVSDLPSMGSASPEAKASAPPAFAPTSAIMGERIAAVVNDDIISTSDIRARISLIILSSGMKNSPEVERQLLPQVLRGLMDEKLQLQEAKRLEITASQTEIDSAMSRLAEENRIPGGDMRKLLAANGIPAQTMEDQMRSGIAWSKVVQRALRPRVEIGEDEIDAAIERIKANAGKQEYLVSEIYLAVDSPSDEDRVRSLVENLAQKIREGAPFGAVARQFSQSSAAANGGDIGWIQAGQLSADLDKELLPLEVGQMSSPIRSTGGFYILGVREKRTVAAPSGSGEEMFVLRQAFAPFADAMEREKILSQAETLRKSVSGCASLDGKLGGEMSAWQAQEPEEVESKDVPPWISENIRDVAKGRAGEAILTDRGALLVFACDRKTRDGIDRDALTSAIGAERLELLARRLMRDLRRNAYIDIRMDY